VGWRARFKSSSINEVAAPRDAAPCSGSAGPATADRATAPCRAATTGDADNCGNPTVGTNRVPKEGSIIAIGSEPIANVGLKPA
jgi:hypothetical protein